MIDFESELERILSDDPLDLLRPKPKAAKVTADDRLLASFEEICVFYAQHGREPADTSDIMERRLFARLKGFRSSPDKMAALTDHDRFELLKEAQEELAKVETVDDILDKDVLGILDDGYGEDEEAASILELKNVRKRTKSPVFTARRKKCDEFDTFEPLFKSVHEGLAKGTMVKVPFQGERQITKGAFFLVQGMLVHVANVGAFEKKNFGNTNARLYCVFENGTESNMLLRSLAASLWKGEGSAEILPAHNRELDFEGSEITQATSTGFIYVLRSKSDDPSVQALKNLHKIGYSRESVEERVKNARRQTTYLMADVDIVADFETFDLNPQTLEHLLHRFFAKARVEIEVADHKGRRKIANEWFVAPIRVIQQAVTMTASGDVMGYEYSPEKERIVPLEEG